MLKLGAFGLKIGTFTCLLVAASYLCRISCGIYYGLVAGMWYLKRSSISSALPTQKVGMGLAVNLKKVHHPAIFVTFFQIREYTHSTIDIELV